MTTARLLAIVKDRGLRLELRDGRPLLIRPRGNDGVVTDALLAVLRRHRERLIAALKDEGKS